MEAKITNNGSTVNGQAKDDAKRSEISFRKRLLMTLGPVLGIALVLMGVLAWLFAFSWLTYSEQSVLDAEIDEVGRQVLRPDGTIAVERYSWNEPHHRFDTEHIDPYFLQIFDSQGRLLRASANIGLFGADQYPNRLLAYQTEADWWVQRLRVFEVGDRRLYHRTRAITNDAGQLLGYVQVARYDPGIQTIMRRTTWVILAGLVPVFLSLLALVWWSARRVVGPLEKITRDASELSPRHLEARINVPTKSDTETVQLATTLNNLLERLELSFDKMQRFTADAAHELQTPLTILKGHVNVALRRERTVEEYQHTLGVASGQIEGLIHLVQGLLKLARLDKKDGMQQAAPLDIAALIRHVATHFIQEATEKGVAFDMDLPAEAWVNGHESFVQEIVVNLLENAVKYTEQGRIHVQVIQTDRDVKLVVEDTGVGMSEDVRRHATDRFYRAPTSNVQDIPGSGLGLALVAEIVAREEGKLHLASNPGQGTRIEVIFMRASV